MRLHSPSFLWIHCVYKLYLPAHLRGFVYCRQDTSRFYTVPDSVYLGHETAQPLPERILAPQAGSQNYAVRPQEQDLIAGTASFRRLTAVPDDVHALVGDALQGRIGKHRHAEVEQILQ